MPIILIQMIEAQIRMGNISHCSSWKQLAVHISCCAKQTDEGPQRLQETSIKRVKSPEILEGIILSTFIAESVSRCFQNLGKKHHPDSPS